MYKIKEVPEDFVVEEILEVDRQKKGGYSYFLMVKKNITTEDAIQNISKAAGIPRKAFGYAGTKDKNAVTTQFVSIQNLTKDLKELNLKDIKLSFVGIGSNKINLGSLVGNKFEIIVRNLEPDYELPADVLVLPNYFDEQRFSTRNYDTGKALLKRDFKTAAEIVSGGTGNYERAVKEYLNENKRDYIGALRKIPSKTLLFYINAVQSFIFNESVAQYFRYKVRKYKVVDYSLGTFIFPEEKVPNILVPVVGFGTEFQNHKMTIIISDILKKEEIELRDFAIREFPEISAEGDHRTILIDVYNLDSSELEDDELNPGKKKIKLKFELTKGCYATILVKALFG